MCFVIFSVFLIVIPCFVTLGHAGGLRVESSNVRGFPRGHVGASECRSDERWDCMRGTGMEFRRGLRVSDRVRCLPAPLERVIECGVVLIKIFNPLGLVVVSVMVSSYIECVYVYNICS